MQHKIKPIDGDEEHSMLAIDIFSKVLEYLKTMLLEFINKILEEERKKKNLMPIKNTGDVRWVLTVPAIWGVGARYFMRKAAYKVILYVQ